MGKIFGISDLPVSIIGKTIQPVQDLVPKPFCRIIKKVKPDKFVKTPVQDSFVKNIKKTNTKMKNYAILRA